MINLYTHKMNLSLIVDLPVPCVKIGKAFIYSITKCFGKWINKMELLC